MFEMQTYAAILKRLKEQVQQINPGMDSAEGSFIHDVLAPAALELAQLYADLDLVLNFSFAQTTHGQYLNYRAGEHGLERKPATQATGVLKVTGTQGVEIVHGQIFVTDGGIEFESTAAAVIRANGMADVNVRARNAGITGNVPPGTIKKAQATLQGVTEITNESAITGGTDQETDQDLLARLLIKVRNPATSGNVFHYWQWAGEVTGVGDAKVFPLWDGPGTVKVVIIDSEKAPAQPQIVTDTHNYIQSVRPVGAEVTVESAAGVAIDVAAKVTLRGDYTLGQVVASFEQLLSAHLKEIAFKQGYVSYAKIGSILLETPGILDHSDLTINGETSNIDIGATAENCEVAVAGTVTLNE